MHSTECQFHSHAWRYLENFEFILYKMYTVSRDVVLKTTVLVSRPELCGLGFGTCVHGLGLGLEGSLSDE